MDEEEFIRQAKLDWDDMKVDTIEEALEACYMNGDYDEVGGDAEAPTGHYYQIDRWIVVTNSDGIHTLRTFETEEDAEAAFEILEREFTVWLKQEEGV